MDCWLCMPFHLIGALGWDCHQTFPTMGGSFILQVDMQPKPQALHMPVDIMRDTWRIWCFVAQLEHQALSSAAAGIEVEVQLVARRLWTGRLPGTTTLSLVSQWWHKASDVCHLLAGHRVFSGPHAHDECTTLEEIKQDPKTCVLRRSGRLLITIHPEVRGGGAKTEASNWAKTRAASLCLAHGVDLSATTTFVDQLAAAAGIQRLSMTLQEGPADGRWEALLELAKHSDVAAPAVKNLQTKAENRARQAQQRKQRHNRMHISASEVQINPGFFLNEDGSSTNILSTMQPGVSGIKLVEESEAIGLLQALRGVQPDELGLLVLGHSCPAPDECNGHLTFPATSVACGSKLLLAGCLHNVGGRRIRAQVADGMRVELPHQCCCTVDCFADELDQDTWSSLLNAPVRSAVDAFKKQGVEAPFTDPWGRFFSLANKPSLPALADRLSFQARVAQDKLDALLAASGHNHFYVTPRAMDRSILTSYAIIWIGGCRAEALRASLQVPGQLGLARVKSRYGLRIAEARFAEVFAQLRPGQMVPTKVQVSKMFRLGPLPPEAGATEIVTWAGKAAWNVKVIKSLGARHWLLGAAQDPPAAFTSFNGQAVLIEPLNRRETAPPVVQAGTRLAVQTTRASTKPSTPVGDDPWLHNDPWAQAAKAMTTNSFASGASVQSLPSTSSSRQLTGPTEQRFLQQESRLQVLEEGLEALRVRQETNHQELLHQQSADRERAASTSLQIQEQMSLMSAEFSKQLRLSTESLQGSQMQQQTQMQSSLDELKCLMLSCRETRDGAKKAKTQPDSDL